MKKTALFLFLLFFNLTAFSLEVELTTIPAIPIGNVPLQVDFTATLTETGTANYIYTWDFGDGSSQVITTSSEEENIVSHTYAEAGYYIARITVTDNTADSAQDTQRIEAYELTVDLVADSTRIYENETITFTANAINGSPPYVFEWDYGDGQTEITNSPANVLTHTYPSIGVYDVKVTVTDTRVEQAEDTETIGVRDSDGNVPPVANAGGPYIEEPGIQFILNANQSYDLDGTLDQYRWRITTIRGDPQCPTSTLVSASAMRQITCYGIGTAEVELRIRDNPNPGTGGGTGLEQKTGINSISLKEAIEFAIRFATDTTTIVVREVQKDDIVNIVKMELKPEVVNTEDIEVIVTARNVTGQNRDININYEIKDMENNSVGITGSILNEQLTSFEQKDFIITITNASLGGLTTQQNYWVYATAETEGENNTTFNSRRTIFSYNELRSIQLPETNLIGLLGILIGTLIIMKNNKRKDFK